ncbi:MAG: DUF368 domain-containing protein [Candidatus Omnitrophica bacterium]|nr:DUF368 domain-containing protein [Candidatus Omnitrophota bacterium]
MVIAKSHSLKSYLVFYVKGFCVGIGNIAPGISGGTVALILGIYEDIIRAVRCFNFKLLKQILSFKIREALASIPWGFLIPLALGALTAIFSIAKLISWLFEHKPFVIWPFFFGLIFASAAVVSRRVKKWNGPRFAALALGAAGSFFVVGLVPAKTPDTSWFLFLTGALTICSSFLPGLSGDFMLVILGKYRYVLDAVSNLDFHTIFIVASGCVVGLIAFARVLEWLLENYHEVTMTVLTGFMLGSLRRVWPWKETIATALDRHGKIVPVVQKNIWPSELNGEVLGAAGLILLAIVLVLVFEYLTRERSS